VGGGFGGERRGDGDCSGGVGALDRRFGRAFAFPGAGPAPGGHCQKKAGFAAGGLATEGLVILGDDAVFVLEAEQFLVLGNLSLPHGDDSLEYGLAVVMLAEGPQGVEDQIGREGKIDDQFFDQPHAVLGVEIPIRRVVLGVWCFHHPEK
jgi:hypothetical protein